ncbi:hypothetical protein ID866_1404 [Astraeus odoratus]|nr:hypothetical protein ID866_1404 [Astraeus odoratus]
MSANKYANLPDIVSPDVYETEDVIPSSHTDDGDLSDDEPSTRVRNRAVDGAIAPGHEELDTSNLISPDEASKRFRKAERKRRQRTRYAYPPSPSSSRSRSASRSPSPTRRLSLPARLRALQAELGSLEAELADPSNPALQPREKGGEGIDPGEMIRGLVDVRRRLEKVRNAKEGRGRLVDVVLGPATPARDKEDGVGAQDEEEKDVLKDNHAKVDVQEARNIIEMDKRVGELEKLIGSVNVTLDEVSGHFTLVTSLLNALADNATDTSPSSDAHAT